MGLIRFFSFYRESDPDPVNLDPQPCQLQRRVEERIAKKKAIWPEKEEISSDNVNLFRKQTSFILAFPSEKKVSGKMLYIHQVKNHKVQPYARGSENNHFIQ